MLVDKKRFYRRQEIEKKIAGWQTTKRTLDFIPRTSTRTMMEVMISNVDGRVDDGPMDDDLNDDEGADRPDGW